MSSVKDLDLLLQSFVDKGIPGCALKVVQNGTTLYEGYFGHSDTSGTPLTDKSVFRLASMSKIPLYTAMMMSAVPFFCQIPSAHFFRNGPQAKNTSVMQTAISMSFRRNIRSQSAIPSP